MKKTNMPPPPQQLSSKGISAQEDVVISVEHISKKFCRNLRRSMAYGMVDLSTNLLGLKPKTEQLRKDEFWALDDISFELRRGETLGIIGVNGSGKSTLLRLLTGIFPPDKGEIRVNGRVGALVAVGAGFHPHMTGRENIFLNGSILGMSRKEIEIHFEEIVSFAEIGDFLDAPVSSYSSGMRVRLGFAIAIHCQPDILLVDEILSVGDLSFRNKSLRYMSEYRQQANAVIFVSHNLEQVRVLCDKVIILDKGQIVYAGATHQGIACYEERARELRLRSMSSARKEPERGITSTLGDYQSQDVKLSDIGVLSETGVNTHEIYLDAPLRVYGELTLLRELGSLFFTVAVIDEQWTTNIIRVVSDDNDKILFGNVEKGTYRLKLNIQNHHLVPGLYFIHIAVRNADTNETYARAITEHPIKIKGNGQALDGRGLIHVSEDWALEKILATHSMQEFRSIEV